MSYSVYIHLNKVNGKKYVGICRTDPVKRWQSGYYHNKHFSAAIKKYGWENFEHYIIDVESEEKMFELEKFYIDYYKTTDPDKGYNSSSGGESGNNKDKNCYSNEYKRQWYADNIEKVREYSKNYRDSHKEKIKEYNRKSHQKHKEERNAISLAYHYQHRDEILKRQKRNREKIKQNKLSDFTECGLW